MCLGISMLVSARAKTSSCTLRNSARTWRLSMPPTPVFTPACLWGSSLGGGLLKLRCVHVGFRLELCTDRGCLITSPVGRVAIAPPIAATADAM